MNELSLYILDLVQNSFVADATLVTISIIEDTKNNQLKLIIEDNGKGMSQEFLKNVCDPFTTTRTTRKVGLGIPLFKQMVEDANGTFNIESKEMCYTKITAIVERDNIDLVPLGNIADTLYLLTTNMYNCAIIYKHIIDKNEFIYSSEDILEIVGEVITSDYETIMWVKDYINENIKELKI